VENAWSDVDATMTLAGARVTPDHLNRMIDAVARQVAGAAGLAVIAHPAPATIASILGGLKAGVPVIPISVDAGPRERDHILVDSGAELLADGTSTIPIRASSVRSAGSAPGLVLYTSGTTGAPKGVPISTAAMAGCIDAVAEAWAWTSDDVLVHGLPLHHVHGLVLGVLGAVRVGCEFIHTGRPTPSGYAAAGGSLYFGVPTVWSRITDDVASAQVLSGARLLVSGSAALPRSVFEALTHLTGAAPVERYGMTETLITLSTRADGPRPVGSVGHPLAGIQTRIVDDHGRVLAHDAESIGELEVLGVTVFDGYLNRPDATAAAFTADGWFRTGDAAAVDRTGQHRIIGRLTTDVIKSGGYRIGAGEVEDALLDHPAVAEAAVVGRPDDDLGQRVVAFVVANGIDKAGLIEHVGTQLSWHKRPRQVVFVDSLPRNAMGEVEKTRLPDSTRLG
jgi:fatty acid CoA ligase FadD36